MRKKVTRSIIRIKCPDCHKNRFIAIYNLKRSTYTGRCSSCSRQHNGQSCINKVGWIGKKGIRKTGRYGCNGYVEVYIDENSKFYPMVYRSRRNRILEHRLVMAIHLDRLLTSSEIVHHINGIKTDNRIENLALTTRGQHEHNNEYRQFIKILQIRIRQLEYKNNTHFHPRVINGTHAS